MKTPTILEFNHILDSISNEDTNGQLFIFDIKIHNKNPKTMLFNETYPLIFEKNKTVCPHERSTIQLLSVLNRNMKKNIINSFKCRSETHLALDDKIFIRLCA